MDVKHHVDLGRPPPAAGDDDDDVGLNVNGCRGDVIIWDKNLTHTPSIAFRHLPPKKDVVNQRLESGSRLSAHPEIFPVSNSVQILQKSFGRDSINRGHTGVCIYCP